MQSVKLIAVYDPGGKKLSILRRIMDLCGRANYRAAPAGEPLRPEELPCILLAGAAGSAADRDVFQKLVAPYGGQENRSGGDDLCVTYSTDDDRADYTAKNIRIVPEGRVAFEIVGAGVIGRVKLNGTDPELVEHVLAAAAAAITAGMAFAEVLNALNTIQLEE